MELKVVKVRHDLPEFECPYLAESKAEKDASVDTLYCESFAKDDGCRMIDLCDIYKKFKRIEIAFPSVVEA